MEWGVTNYQLPITNYQLPITNYQWKNFCVYCGGTASVKLLYKPRYYGCRAPTDTVPVLTQSLLKKSIAVLAVFALLTNPIFPELKSLPLWLSHHIFAKIQILYRTKLLLYNHN